VFGVAIDTLAIVWLGAFVGSLAAGGAGFAFALASSSIWLHVLEPIQVTALVVACGTILHLGLIVPMRKSIDRARLWPFLLAALFGIPLGVQLLAHTNTDLLKSVLGIFLVLFGLYALLAPRLPYIGGGGRTADAAIGFIGGVLGGLGGYSGVLPTIWTQLRGWPKEVARGVYQPFILFAHLFTLILVGRLAFDRTGLILLVTAIPFLLAGAAIGWAVYGRLDERRFRQVLGALLAISGAALAV
jgi:uncharacterized membrane protein YfcA